VSQLPTVLQNAIDLRSRNGRQRLPIELSSSRVERGDLRFVRSIGAQLAEVRLALVLSVDGDRGCAEIMLVHTAPELACDIDLVVAANASCAPYEVVIETDLRGVIWTWQVGKSVGRISSRILIELQNVVRGCFNEETSTSHLRIGPRLTGPADSRWAFKKDEGEIFRYITADATEALLDDGSPWVVDTGLFQPELLGVAEDPGAVILELFHWIRTRPTTISAKHVEHLFEVGALDGGDWSMMGDLGNDIWTVLQELIERVATAERDDSFGVSGRWRLVTAAHLESVKWNRQPERIHILGQREAVAR
jgi:hypothetical protein